MQLGSALLALSCSKAVLSFSPLVGVTDVTTISDSQQQLLQDDSIMDTLESPFTISINGKPISSVVASDGAEPPIPAKLGSDAAVFTLKNGRLQSGEWVLARNCTENRSMLPKEVLWFKDDIADAKIKPVAAEKHGSAYKLTFAGAPLTESDDRVLADLIRGGAPNVVVKLQ